MCVGVDCSGDGFVAMMLSGPIVRRPGLGMVLRIRFFGRRISGHRFLGSGFWCADFCVKCLWMGFLLIGLLGLGFH